MKTRNLETKLDDALTQFAQGASVDTAMRCAPDVADLISLAEHLQILAPVPDVRLAEGQRKFLNEAAHLVEPRVAPRRELSIVVVAMIVLLAGGALIIATLGLAASFSGPVQQATLTPTLAPTFSATPSTSALVPKHAGVAAGITFSAPQTHVPIPVPTPVPHGSTINVYSRDMVLTRCLMS